MDNLQLWIYIAVGIIYFLAKSRKKSTKPPVTRKPTPHRDTSSSPSESSPTQRPMTFEELLREITESKRPSPAPAPRREPAPPTSPYVDYDDNVGDEEHDLEEVNIDRSDDIAVRTYEQAKREAFSRPSLEVSPPEQTVEAVKGRFKSFENSPENRIFEDYIKDLRDPEGFRKAFILSELINRRHF